MDAPQRSVNPFIGKPVREEEKDAVEMKSHPAERVTHVANPALRKAMEETTQEIAKKKPVLASFIKPHESLEENFFRLMDTIHFLAQLEDKDQAPQGATEQEKLSWECKNLLKIAKQLSLPRDREKLYWTISGICHSKDVEKSVKTAIGLADHLPENDRFSLLVRAFKRSGSDELKFEVLTHFPPQKFYDHYKFLLRDLLRSMQDHKKAASWVHSYPNAEERALLYIHIASGLIEKGEHQKAHPYIDEALKSYPYGIYPLSLALFHQPQLSKLPLESVFYVVSKVKPEEKDVFLFHVATILQSKNEYEDFINVLEAMNPGNGRDQRIEEIIRNLPKNAPEWVKGALRGLISDPVKRRNQAPPTKIR